MKENKHYKSKELVKAFFPGTFDPITLGHIALAKRASKLFDELFLGIYSNQKHTLFDVQERLQMAKGEFLDTPNIKVVTYNSLTVETALEFGAKALLRGLRIGGDFEYERGMALVNLGLSTEVETVCLMSTANYQHISSSRVREIAHLGGDVSNMVPSKVSQALKNKYAELKK